MESNKENIETGPSSKDNNELLWIGGNNSSVDLQKNFERFRKQKKEQIKYRNYVAEKSSVGDRSDPAVKKRLREKFVETAKKYFGVPYAQRYWQPNEPLYNSPIFLDCCALVRQVVYDMREDLGFTLDKWNQCYQVDTLPIKLEKEQMQPGDLIFYSGTYYNTKLRPQKHDMVHVEIYTGGETGEQSIGARWQRGVVQYFDSYKFESKAYHSIQFHYRSIDTWLEGICKSFCQEHSWKSTKLHWAPGKHSIFSPDNEYDENDLNAPDVDDGFVEAGKAGQEEEERLCFIGGGNNPRLPRDALLVRGFKELARGMQFSEKFRFKWTQTSSEINFLKVKEGTHIVNHISNSRIFTQKGTTLEVLEVLKIAMEKGEITSEEFKGLEFFPETYRLDFVADLVNFLKVPDQGLWVVKKSNSNQGKGIRLISDVAAYKEELLTKKGPEEEKNSTQLLEEKMQKMGLQEGQGQEEEEKVVQEKKKWTSMIGLAKELSETIVQKYLEKPLLIDGRKFDMRVYMLIACSKPYLVLFHPGYVRLSLNKFTTENFASDKLTHLTNNSVQKKHPEYSSLKEQSIMSIQQLESYLTAQQLVTSPEDFRTRVLTPIREILRLTFLTVKDKLDRKFGCFELFGFDVMLDEGLRPHLLEINTNPALFTDTQPQKDLLPKLVDDVVALGLELHPFGKLDGAEEVEKFVKEGVPQLQLPYDVVYKE